jgi:hypothetical protein
MTTGTRTHGRSPRPAGRCWRWAAGILATVALSLGCSPFSTLGFLFNMSDRLEQPVCPLAREDKETRIAVVVIAGDQYFGGQQSLMKSDRDLMDRLTRELDKRYKDHDPKVTLVPTMQVVAFLNRNPGAREMSGYQIGKALTADYVVKLEIGAMTLYDRISASQAFRGRAEIIVEATDVSKPAGEGVMLAKEVDCQYPKGTFHDVDDMPRSQFQAKFLDRITREIAQFFAPYEPQDKFTSD